MTRIGCIVLLLIAPLVAQGFDVQATIKRVDVENSRVTFGAPDGRDRTAKVALAQQIQPLDKDGKPAADGKIVLCTIGFSNTSQCSQGFIEAARGDNTVNPQVVVVNGAQGGRSAFMIKDANDGSLGTAYWKEWVPGQLASAGVTAAQVQTVWLKQTEASIGPAMLA